MNGTEVERLSVDRAQLRFQRYRDVVDVGDLPDGNLEVETAGLGRDVPSGKSEPQIGGGAVGALLGQNSAVSVLGELVDDDTVKTGEDPQF